jgi:nitroreductase
MDVIKAILARHSVRDFSSKPVAKEKVMKILKIATRSPSGGNAQPWEVFVASGATLEKIRKVYQETTKRAPRRPGRSGGTWWTAYSTCFYPGAYDHNQK